MISLSYNFEKIKNAIASINSSDYIKAVINLYLESYNTDYNFCQFYLCVNESDETYAVILRYNSYIYLLSDDKADCDELHSFISGFSSSVLYCDRKLATEFKYSKECYIMKKQGEKSYIASDVKDVSDTPLKISELITVHMPDSEKEDFFLNTAHQLRHGKLRVFAKIIDGKLVSVAGVTVNSDTTKAISFVYTDEYFRGNGYSREVLAAICNDTTSTYELLCEEHNIKFYNKCGFKQVSSCYEVLL